MKFFLLPDFSYEITSQLNAGNGLYIIGLKEIVSSSEETVHYIRNEQNQRFLLITGGQAGRQMVSKVNDLS
jgi:hypothetical protein